MRQENKQKTIYLAFNEEHPDGKICESIQEVKALKQPLTYEPMPNELRAHLEIALKEVKDLSKKLH